MAQRVKGQEVALLFNLNNTPVKTVTDFRSFEMTWQTETKSEGYLGETTNRRDDVFNGIMGKVELHFENQDVFNLIQAIVDRARRREPGTTITLKVTLQMPNGQRPRVTIPNCFFGAIPMNFGSRTDYGTISLDFEAENATVLTT